MPQQYAKDQPAGYDNYLRKVAIVGAGGSAGKLITSALLAGGKHKVTALTRSDSSTALPPGVTVAKVDYADPASITAALRGHDILVITLPNMNADALHDTIVTAAAAAGLRWIMPNGYGNHMPPAAAADVRSDKSGRRAHIEAEGMSWVHLATGFWYEYSVGGGEGMYGFDVPGRRVRWLDDGETKINTTTFPQLGRAAAALLSLKVLPDDADDKAVCLDHFRNDTARVASFTVSQRDVFASLLRVTGTTEADWTQSTKTARQAFEEGRAMLGSAKGDRKTLMEGYGTMLYARMFFKEDTPGHFSARAKGERYPLINEALGLPKEDLDEFTRAGVELANSDYYFEKYGVDLRKGR